MKKLQKKLQLLSILLVAGLLFSSLTIPVRAFIQKQGTVNEAVTLRQNASSGSAQVMELTNGQAVTVNNEITGNDGAKWYQIFVNGTTLGYVPANTITISEGSSTNTGTNAGTNTNPAEGTQQTTQTITITERIGTVTTNGAIRVRAEASTTSTQIASMESQDTFLVLSDVNGSDGYVWHEVQFDDHGTEVHGYVRSDLVSVKDVTREEQVPAENPSEMNPSEPADTSAPYSITSQVNAEGATVWYLMDNATGDAKEISSLLTPQETKSNNGVYKIIVVVLLILVILAAAAATFFYMRWQDAEEFIYELREKQVRAKKQPAPSQAPRTAPAKQQTATKQAPASAAAGKPSAAQQAMSEITPKNTSTKAVPPQHKPIAQPVSRSVAKPASQPVSKPISQSPGKQTSQEVLPKTSDIVKITKQELQNKQTSTTAGTQSNTWKSKNFLTDDDDLEFDFLDMEDK